MGLVLPRGESADYASRSSPNPTLWPPWLMLLPSIKADSVSFTPGGQTTYTSEGHDLRLSPRHIARQLGLMPVMVRWHTLEWRAYGLGMTPV